MFYVVILNAVKEKCHGMAALLAGGPSGRTELEHTNELIPLES